MKINGFRKESERHPQIGDIPLLQTDTLKSRTLGFVLERHNRLPIPGDFARDEPGLTH